MTSKRKTHYSGAICYDTNGTTVHVSGGSAICCSGERARRVKRKGNATTNESAVACKLCLTLLAKRVHCAVHPESCCTGGEDCAR